MPHAVAGAFVRADVLLHVGGQALLYDQSIAFLGGSPQEGDAVILHDTRRFLVSSRCWVEGKDGVFRLEMILSPWPCYDESQEDE